MTSPVEADTMTAIAVEGGKGPAEALKPVRIPWPTPGEGQILIRVRAAGVNRPDILQRLGGYPPPPGAPDTMGLEVAGEVVVGAGRWNVGDRVCALLGGGGYAEYAVCDARHALPIPVQLGFVEAAGLPETVFTVYANVFEGGALRRGETLMVHGATSGIGTTAIQMGKAAGGVDVVLDMVGGDYVLKNLDALKTGGRIVFIAALGGGELNVPIFRIMQKRAVITGSTLRPRDAAEKARLTHQVEQVVWPWVVSGKVKTRVDATFPLEDAAKAHAHLEGGAHVGKVVLTTG